MVLKKNRAKTFRIQIVFMEQKKLVSVLMPTYNHEKYIAQAIESALMQKTDFAWELLIHDDCSTDGTLHIARRYANFIRSKSNEGKCALL